MDGVPGFAADLARYLHHQLDRTRQRLSILAAIGARAKLAGYLLAEAEQRARTGDEPVVPQQLTQRDLGAMLGLSAETVCRELGSLRRRGVTATDRKGIRIRDLDTLRRLAAS